MSKKKVVVKAKVEMVSEIDPEPIKHPIKSGDAVMIIEGKFKMYEGLVKRIQDGKATVVIEGNGKYPFDFSQLVLKNID